MARRSFDDPEAEFPIDPDDLYDRIDAEREAQIGTDDPDVDNDNDDEDLEDEA